MTIKMNNSIQLEPYLGGITLPETIHQGIVRDHLAPLELKRPQKKESNL